MQMLSVAHAVELAPGGMNTKERTVKSASAQSIRTAQVRVPRVKPVFFATWSMSRSHPLTLSSFGTLKTRGLPADLPLLKKQKDFFSMQAGNSIFFSNFKEEKMNTTFVIAAFFAVLPFSHVPAFAASDQGIEALREEIQTMRSEYENPGDGKKACRYGN